MQQSDELKLAIKAAQKAASIIKSGFGKTLEITEKENNEGIVTQIDRQAEEIIIKTLQNSSSYPILAEESGVIGQLGDSYWVIDPLDGTRNYSRGIPIFAVSIALIKANSVVLGVTLNPLTGDVYYAEKGKGAYLNSKQLCVSKRSKDMVVIFDKGYSKESALKFREAVDKLGLISVVRSLGSSTLEACFIAQGSYEGFISFGDKLWDYAAGVLLIQEAGGKVTDWQGNKWTINNQYFLATNNLIHDKIRMHIDTLQTAS